MKPKILLRIAALLMLLHTIGHTFGAVNWKNTPNATIAGIIEAMEKNHFVFMGVQASIAGFYVGYGIILIFVLLMVTVLLWLLADNYQRAIVIVLAVFLAAMGITEFIYFFPLAAAFSLLAGSMTGLSLLKRSQYKKL
jgi:hypothetical protein